MGPVLDQKKEMEAPFVEQHASIPQVRLTFDQAKRQIDGGRMGRPECPDEVVKAILKSGNPKEAILEVKSALDGIAKAAGHSTGHAFQALSNEKVAGLFVSHTEEFVEIAKAAGDRAGYAFEVLSNEKVAGLFVEKPEVVIDAFGKIAKAAGNRVWAAFSALSEDNKVAGLFVSHTEEFVEIAKAAGHSTGYAFQARSNEKVAGLFVEKPEVVIDAFGKIAKAAGINAACAFLALSEEKDAPKLEEYCKGSITFDILMLNIKASDRYAIEMGRRLDELHDSEAERKKYLASLSKTDVLALLLSNPDYFYTSSNHLLFDRLNSDFEPGELSRFLSENGLEGTELHRNLIFRAANYDRLYGNDNSVFRKSDILAVLSTLTGPLEAEGFDPRYFYLLANTLGSFDAGLTTYIGRRVVAAQVSILFKDADWVGRKRTALHFLLEESQNPGKNEAVFDSSNYRDTDGKLLIVQVFDKGDTEKDHWVLSQKWFSKYGKPRTGDAGELVYETNDARIVLFMGETTGANRKFVSSLLDKNPNMILTFRGHSFSLNENIPTDILANRKANILFLPGSCGSSGVIPAYIEASPGTSFEFVANTSTGRGQVTNALVDIFINEAASGLRRTYNTIIKKDKNNCSFVEANGGDCSTLKVDTVGERLLEQTRAVAR